MCPKMKSTDLIPMFNSEGRSLGFRPIEAAMSLIRRGFAKPSYGRKGHLRSIWQISEDGSNPVVNHAPAGTKYSSLKSLDNGTRSWQLHRIDPRDEDGNVVSLRPAFLQVVSDCLVR